MMSSEFLIKVLNEKSEFDKCVKWLSGQTIEIPEHGIKRHEFSLFFLNFLQEQTSSILDQKKNKKEIEIRRRRDNYVKNEPQHRDHSKKDNINKPLAAGGPVRRIFSPEREQLPNRSTVTRGEMQHRTNVDQENIHSPQDFSPSKITPPMMLYNPQLGCLVPYNYSYHDRITPERYPHPNFYPGVHYNRVMPQPSLSPQTYCYNNNHILNGIVASKQDVIDPRMNATRSPIKNNNCYQTPKSNSYNQNYTTRSASSGSSDIQILSPESPSYSNNFPEMGSNERKQNRSRQSPNLGDFITWKSPTNGQSKKQTHNKKRIKPTQLTYSSPANILSPGSAENTVTKFGFDSFTKVPEVSASESDTNKTCLNLDEERSLLKQKKQNSVNISVKSSKKTFSPNNANKERLMGSTTERKEDVVTNEKLKEVSSIANNICINKTESGNSEEYIEPDFHNVGNKWVLDKLAEIYCVLLDSNLIPNITVEIYFVFSLLTVKVTKTNSKVTKTKCKNKSKSAKNMSQKVNMDNVSSNASLEEEIGKPLLKYIIGNELETIDQCVYFASSVLEKQTGIIQLFDKMTLKLLIENKRLEEFSPNLVSQLKELYVMQDKELKINQPLVECTAGIHPVQFQVETDNKDTFSTNQGFYTFRKQRDALYNIIQTWNEMHDKPGWSFEKIAVKVEKLLSMSSDPVNMRHLSKHFCDLLIRTVTSKEEVQEGQLSNLPDIDKSKLSLLTERLTRPSSEKNISPRPVTSFPGLQQFYHDFLVLPIPNYFFNMHLINCLMHQISVLNSLSYDVDDSDGNGNAVQEETRDVFLEGLNSLCVIAKFLGLLVFAPYRSSSELPQTILQDEISMREKMEVPLDLKEYLSDAESKGRLVYTIPWVIEFLGMMDSTAPHLPVYQDVLKMLFSLYLSTSPLVTNAALTSNEEKKDSLSSALETIKIDQKEESCTQSAKNRYMLSSMSASFIRLNIGWLFDTSNLPQTLFSKIAAFFNEHSFTEGRNKKRQEITIDGSDLVNEKVIHKCCPYLKSIRVHLASCTDNKVGSVRHITPVPSNKSFSFCSPEITPEVALELQLEEHFFLGQSESVRRTVDFVAERVASACIKHICSVVIVNLKKKVLDEHVQNKMVNVQPFIVEYNTSVMEQIEKVKKERLGIALKALLGPDIIEQSLHNICQQIAGRKCQERVVNWLQSHINIEELLMKIQVNDEDDKDDDDDNDMQSDDDNLTPESNDIKGMPKTYDESTTVAKMFILFQDGMNDALETCGQQGLKSEEELVEIFSKCNSALYQNRKQTAVLRQFLSFAVDYLLITVAFRPQIVTSDVLKSFCNLLKEWNCPEVISHLLSQRNVLLLSQGDVKSYRKVWNKFSDIITYLVKADVLKMKHLEAQAVALFRFTWPDDILKLISTSLRTTMEDLRSHSGNDPEFTLMLELLSEIAAEISDADDQCSVKS